MYVSACTVMSGSIQMGQNTRTGRVRARRASASATAALQPREQRVRRRVEPQEHGEVVLQRHGVGDGLGKRQVDGDAARGEARDEGFGVLLLVGEHEVGREGHDGVQARVLRAADAYDLGQRRGGLDAVVRAPDEPIARAEHRHGLGLARHEGHHPSGRAREAGDGAEGAGALDHTRQLEAVRPGVALRRGLGLAEADAVPREVMRHRADWARSCWVMES
jgi:hypothetical protein